MVFGERTVFIGLVQVVPKHLPAVPLRGNIGEPRTALLKFGCLRVMTVELIILFCLRLRLYRFRIKMSSDSFVILGRTSVLDVISNSRRIRLSCICSNRRWSRHRQYCE